MKPVVHGYLALWQVLTPAEVAQKRQALAAFAQSEGYALAQIYEERDVGGAALGAVIDRCREDGAAAVLIHSPTDLSRMARVQTLTRRRIEHEAGVPVLIVEQALTAEAKP